jgi:hypothetical protein
VKKEPNNVPGFESSEFRVCLPFVKHQSALRNLGTSRVVCRPQWWVHSSRAIMSANEEAVAATAARIVELDSFRHDYSKLLDTLRPLPLKTAHSIRVPLCPVAFAPGKLIHTNEMLVALGDGYFAGMTRSHSQQDSCVAFLTAERLCCCVGVCCADF